MARHPLLPTFRIALLGAAVAGLYGVVHDQISYTISPEYFTRIKFHQFRAVYFGGPPRVFVAEIGFLASWWVGLLAGWILARLGLAELSLVPGKDYVARAIALLFAVTVASACLGVVIGLLQTSGSGLELWRAWQVYFELRHLRAFAVVAFLHWASYIGVGLGLAAAATYVKRKRRSIAQKAA